MISDNRYPIANTASSNKDNISNSNIATFQYNPPNNTGTTLGILGGVLTTVGDALGAIIQLNTDNTADFESQVGSFKSDQEMEKMQAEIDDLQEKLKQLEQLIKSDQS